MRTQDSQPAEFSPEKRSVCLASSIARRLLAILLALFALWPLAAGAESIESAMLSYQWKWERNGRAGERLGRFERNGDFRNPSGAGRTVFRWRITGPRVFSLTADQQVTYFTFDEKFTRFEGTITGTDARIVGTRMEPVSEPPKENKVVEAAPVPASGPAGKSHLDTFAETIPVACEWVTAPLHTSVPTSVRLSLSKLTENLKDEVAKIPQASPQAYALALNICESLLNTLKEREAMLEQNKRVNNGVLGDAWVKQWAQRVDPLQTRLETTYENFREAVRQSPRPARTLASSVTPPVFPALPPEAPAPTKVEPRKFVPTNALDRGPYNKTYIWSRRGRIWR